MKYKQHASYTDEELLHQFQEFGFVEIETSHIEEDIVNFYLDISRFLALTLIDDGRFEAEAEKLLHVICSHDIRKIETELQNCLNVVQKVDRQLLSHLYDMGTRPNKFISGERLFTNNEIVKVTNQFFQSKGSDNPLLLKPTKGETLHLFTPGESQFKYNLPIHQDFPYLGQSKHQLTFWLFLSGTPETGGIEVFPRTHQNGAVGTQLNEHGLYEVEDRYLRDIRDNNGVKFGGKQFQLIAVDSLLFHRSIRSTSSVSSRLTYIWRISDANSAGRVPFAKSY